MRAFAAGLLLLLLIGAPAGAADPTSCPGSYFSGACRCADGQPTSPSNCRGGAARAAAPARRPEMRCGRTTCASDFHCSPGGYSA